MTRYRGNPQAIRDLIRPTEVHRDVYIDPEVFQLEMENLFANRCPHKGVKVASEACGNTGKFFRCPYHAWSFKTDGSLLAIPLKKGYEGTHLAEAALGLGRLHRLAVDRP